MIKRTVVTWSAIGISLTLFCSSVAFGSDTSSDDTRTESPAHTLMAISGLNDQLDALPNAVRISFDQLLIADGLVEPFESADVPQLRSAVGSVFNAKALQDSILAELESIMSPADSSELVQFYKTDTGIDLRTAERDNSILENAARFQGWYRDTGLHGLTNERQDVIKKLEVSMQATRGAVDAMIGMQIAMQVSLTPILPAAEQLSPVQLQGVAEELRPELTAIYYESSLETLAFVFKDLSLSALRDYAEVLDTDAGQRYVRAVNDGLSRGLFNSAEKLGFLLQDILAVRLGQGA